MINFILVTHIFLATLSSGFSQEIVHEDNIDHRNKCNLLKRYVDSTHSLETEYTATYGERYHLENLAESIMKEGFAERIDSHTFPSQEIFENVIARKFDNYVAIGPNYFIGRFQGIEGVEVGITEGTNFRASRARPSILINIKKSYEVPTDVLFSEDDSASRIIYSHKFKLQYEGSVQYSGLQTPSSNLVNFVVDFDSKEVIRFLSLRIDEYDYHPQIYSNDNLQLEFIAQLFLPYKNIILEQISNNRCTY